MNSSTSLLLKGLNRRQREAVLHESGPLLIVAGAGTGKTRVIVHRLGYLIEARRTQPERILAVTFTNRAAEEMRRRVSALVGEEGRAISVGTFHWLGQRILRRYGSRLEVGSGFQLFTPQQSMAALRRMLRRHTEITEALAVPEVRDAISALRCGCRKAIPWALDLETVAAEYVAELRRHRALDLDDLILEAVRLLEHNADVRGRLNRHFVEILVDEYQDTNRPQARLLELLTHSDRNITAVGDEDQAIYGWRYADVENMLSFPQRFPGATIVRLEQNYRSTRRILQPANALLHHNQQRLGKTLFSEGDLGQRPRVFAAGDETEEVLFVLDTLRNLLREGFEPREVGILFRVNAQSRLVEEALATAGIAYEVRGGKRFYERPEITRLVDALHVVAQPDEAGRWQNLLIHVPSVGPVRSKSIVGEASGAGSIGKAMAGGSFRAPNSSKSQIQAIAKAIAHIERGATPRDQAQQAADILFQVLGPVGASALEQEAARANVDEFILAASQFEYEESGGLHEFLDRIALSDPQQGREAVQLMTLHSAKGLEFDAVIIIGMQEGLLPHSRSLERIEDVEEERRLLYVGMTRARRRLFLTYSRVGSAGGGHSLSQPSRFIEEIPAHLVEVIHGVGKRPKDRLSTVHVGERVRHPRWGSGQVVDVRGRGRETMVSITFSDGSRQTIQLCHAPLQRVS